MNTLEELLEDVRLEVQRQLDIQDMPQVSLAARMGVTEGRVSHVLTGHRNISLRTLARMADALECDVNLRLIPR